MKLKEIVKAIIAWFTLPFLLANAKMLLPLLAVAPFMIGMTMVALMNEYKRSYDIDYEDKTEVLEGVDANNNGMRDDLERFGEEVYKDWNPIVMRAYHNWLKNLYVVMKKRGVVEDNEKIKYLNSLSCWVSLQYDKRLTDSQVEDTQKDEFLQIAGLAFNTRGRELYQRKDFIFDLSLNADSFYRWIYQCADIGITDQQIFKFQKFE
ncbi:hypothetical protein [Halobacteriovorax sp. CON-3]|uniref:hypothetical protein n=1 Tax=Halobacteriovorax sp. CON-3 TaxID=3157710 RepID=UPI0037147936